MASGPQSQSQPLSAEEEALKSNTDCVYFLASPLTCKKGSECEYRHSDVARVNPRDCWYWLHGNCLNPMCAFRHPPLDGLLGAQTPTSTRPPVPVVQTAATPRPLVPNAPTKQQGVPCVFFQKGYCLKGDWCQFLHTQISLNIKPPQAPGIAFPAESMNAKKPVAAAYEKSFQQNVVPITAVKSFNKDTPVAKPPVQMEFTPPTNEFIMNRRAPKTSGNTEFSGYGSAPHVSNGNPVSWPNRPHLLEDPESMTSKDAEEVSRELSPGFDVLVDDDGRHSDFYTGEDRHGMPRQHNPEYDIDHPNDDYTMIAAVDDERYHSRLGFDSHEHSKGQFAWDQPRALSYRERRPYSTLDNVGGQVDESDLRHRLVKHKKPNGLRSVISREHSRDMQDGDKRYQSSRRDKHHISSRENSVGSRLRGRIGLPQRSLSPNNRDMIRSSISSHQGRIQERIKSRADDGFNDGGNNYRAPHLGRDNGDNNADFAAPKSLAELKNRKNADQQSLGKRKHLTVDGHQERGNFEGPKPLEEILKRKKRETVSGNSSNNEDIVEDKHEEKVVTVEKPKSEDGTLGDDGVKQEYEHGEFDNEQLGGEDYELYGGENGEAEGEYVEEEEDDDDDFAKKMGVVYS